jgi:hypothetical protein
MADMSACTNSMGVGHEQKDLKNFISQLRRPGGYGGVDAPDPIPNSAVKRPSANGTSSQDAGE